MPTPGVVKPLNMVKVICTGFVSDFTSGAKHYFNLQRREESLHCRIVPTLCAPTHAAGDALIDQQAL